MADAEKLNSLLLQMKVAFREQRQDEVRNVARTILQEIKSICDVARGGVTVEAHKDSGRVLRIRSVGEFGITKLTYSGTPNYSGSENHPHDDDCQLLVIDRFSLSDF